MVVIDYCTDEIQVVLVRKMKNYLKGTTQKGFVLFNISHHRLIIERILDYVIRGGGSLLISFI